MSTRSNIILVTPDNKAHQLYHHWDGYLSGVGEELRKHLIYSIGMNTLKDISLYNILLGEIHKDEDYEDEYIYNMNDANRLHADIEYLYIIKDNSLYYVNEWNLCEKLKTYSDLIDYVCKDENEIDLTHPCKDKD